MSMAAKLIPVTVCCLAAAGAASPASPYAAQTLLEDCRAYAVAPESIEATRCAFYVQGFLDSARAHGPSQADGTVRLPFGSRVARIPTGQQGPYCIGSSTSIEEIIHLVLRESERDALQPEAPAGGLLEPILRLHYACDKNALSRR